MVWYGKSLSDVALLPGRQYSSQSLLRKYQISVALIFEANIHLFLSEVQQYNSFKAKHPPT
jgi:hypothetical protein